MQVVIFFFYFDLNFAVEYMFSLMNSRHCMEKIRVKFYIRTEVSRASLIIKPNCTTV